MTSPVGAEPASQSPGSQELAIERRDGATISARTSGDPRAPALLVLDGIGCSGWAFRRIVPQLAEHLFVVQADYPGHGRSPTPPRPWALSMPDLADHAAAVLERLEIARATVVGFSMGFQVALELYRRHRSRVAALVSLAGPSGKALATFQGTDVFAHALPLVRAASRYASVTTMKLWRTVLPSKWLPWLGLHGQLNPMRIELSDLEFYLRQMSEIHPELFLDMLGEAARHTAEDLLPGIRVPTLVIAGAKDRFVPAETQRKIAFAIPTAQWMVIEDGSHALPAEYGPELAARLLAFVDEV